MLAPVPLRAKTLRNAFKFVKSSVTWWVEAVSVAPITIVASGDPVWDHYLHGTFTRESDVARALVVRALHHQVCQDPEHLEGLRKLCGRNPERLLATHPRSALLVRIKDKVERLVGDATAGGRWELVYQCATGVELPFEPGMASVPPKKEPSTPR